MEIVSSDQLWDGHYTIFGGDFVRCLHFLIDSEEVGVTMMDNKSGRESCSKKLIASIFACIVKTLHIFSL